MAACGRLTISKIRLGGVHGAGDIGVKHLNCNSESPEMDPDLVRRVQTGLIIITWLFEKKADPLCIFGCLSDDGTLYGWLLRV